MRTARLGLPLIVLALGLSGAAHAEMIRRVPRILTPLVVKLEARRMERVVKGCATPIVAMYTTKGSFKGTNTPAYETNDVPWQYETKDRRLQATILAPVSGHVPLHGTAEQQRRNAANYARDDVTEVWVNNQKVAEVANNGRYVVPISIDAPLNVGKNVVNVRWRNPKTGESAGTWGFPSGREAQITVLP